MGAAESDPAPAPASLGLTFVPRFAPPGESGEAGLEWVRRDVRIEDGEGTVFEARGVEYPKGWSSTAAAIVAYEYLRSDPQVRWSVRRLVGRVVDAVRAAGTAGGYFRSEADARNFAEDLRWLLLHQHAWFNSPVWFNLGVGGRRQQASACFITSVADSMESILELARLHAGIYKLGSGTGVNLSPLRSSAESVAGSGTASGPVSFMRALDTLAGTIKAGGITRRAATMVILDVGHPDILEFVRCKAEEERKAWALIDAGYPTQVAYRSVQFQNANHSVRVNDEFMRQVLGDGEWRTKAVTDGRVLHTYRARRLMREIAEAAWICGDPGMQFDDTIQSWNCVPASGRIDATNACSELVFLNDTACNLMSLNLMKFLGEEDGFQVERFRHAVEVCLTAQEILVSASDYPSAAIAERTEELRPLGIGYTNLGALLMAMGMPYDSDLGRRQAAAITALLTAAAYSQSARLAGVRGPFSEFELNRADMLRVIRRHRDAALDLEGGGTAAGAVRAAQAAWEEALTLGGRHGFRNAQVSVIAPTGTVSLALDCDTTGAEPELALVRVKRLAGGGRLTMTSGVIPRALAKLGYRPDQIGPIAAHVEESGTIEGAPGIRDADLSVFDCSLKAHSAQRSIAPEGHLRMLAALQPFISGSISKTLNLATETTVDEVYRLYLDAWRLGLKSISIYRDGSKRLQPVSPRDEASDAAAPGPSPPIRP